MLDAAVGLAHRAAAHDEELWRAVPGRVRCLDARRGALQVADWATALLDSLRLNLSVDDVAEADLAALTEAWSGDWARARVRFVASPSTPAEHKASPRDSQAVLGAVACPALEARLPAFAEDLRRQWRARQDAPTCWGAVLADEDEFIST